MKIFLSKAGLTAIILCSLTSKAFAATSANVGIMSDYVWRGWTQNDRSPSLMAGVDYEGESGFYAGAWTAQVDNAGDDLEVDFYGGFSKEMTSGFAFDIGAINYRYPGESLDFTEVYVTGSYGPIEIGLAKTVSADISASEGDLYSHLTLSKNFGELSVSLTAGNYDFEAGGSTQNYQIAAGQEFSFGELTGAISKASDDGDTIFSLTWSKSFDF